MYQEAEWWWHRWGVVGTGIHSMNKSCGRGCCRVGGARQRVLLTHNRGTWTPPEVGAIRNNVTSELVRTLSRTAHRLDCYDIQGGSTRSLPETLNTHMLRTSNMFPNGFHQFYAVFACGRRVCAVPERLKRFVFLVDDSFWNSHSNSTIHSIVDRVSDTDTIES